MTVIQRRNRIGDFHRGAGSTELGAAVGQGAGKLGRDAIEVLRLVCEQGTHGMTAYELRSTWPIDCNTPASRLTNLKDDWGYVEFLEDDDGEQVKRKTNTGFPACVHVATASGREALQREGITMTRARGELPARHAGAEVVQGRLLRVKGWELAVEFYGKPAPQGSKRPGFGGGLQEDNPRTKPWREMIEKWCQKNLADLPVLDGALEAELDFSFDPPKSAKPGDYPTTKMTYDVDKLVRCVFDAMTRGGVWKDDARVVGEYGAKHYVGLDDHAMTEAGVLVKINRMRRPAPHSHTPGG